MENRWLLAAAAVVLLGLGTESSAADLVVNGDFSAGNSGFTSDYPYVSFINTETQFTITSAANIKSVNNWSDWTAVNTDPLGGTGNVLLVNGATSSNVTIWQETVNVTPNTNYAFNFYAVDVNAGRGGDAVIQPLINGVPGASLDTNGTWQNSSYVWNSGTNTTATLSFVDTKTVAALNDFALDNISFKTAAAPGPIPGTGLLSFLVLALAGAATRLRGYLSA